MLKTRKAYAPQIIQRKNKNLMRIMARPLEYLFGSTLGFMKKIKNWQFNPPADEEDEWPTEPRFKPMLYSTMISDNHDN